MFTTMTQMNLKFDNLLAHVNHFSTTLCRTQYDVKAIQAEIGAIIGAGQLTGMCPLEVPRPPQVG